MSNLTINLPEEVYKHLETLAKSTTQSLEDTLVNQIKTWLLVPDLSLDEVAELAALHHLSNDALQTIAREQMPSDIQTRMEILMDRNSQGEIKPEEFEEMQAYNQRADRLMMRKAEAAAILTQRGQA